MKTITIYGSVLIESDTLITEGKGKNIFQNLFGLGNLLSFIPGFAEKHGDKERLDEYQTAQKEWMDTWAKTRKKELEDDAAHKVQLKATNYRINQQRLKNKHDAERKVKEYKQEQERKARKAILAQLEREGAKIKNWTGGPSTEDAMIQIINKTNKIYKDATPAEQQLKDNLLGVLCDIHTDKDGNYISNVEDVKKRLDELYGDGSKGSGLKNPALDTPEFRNAFKEYQEHLPTTKEEFSKKIVKQIMDDPDLKSTTELDDEQRAIENYIEGVQTRQNKINKLKEEKAAIEKNLKNIEAKKEKADKAQEQLEELGKLTSPAEMRTHMRDEVKKAMQDTDNPPLIDKDSGSNQPKQPNRKHPMYQQLKSLGLKDDDLVNLYNDTNTDASIDKILDKIPDENIIKQRDKMKESYEAAVHEYEDAKEAETRNKERLDEIDGDSDKEGSIKDLEDQLDNYKKEHRNVEENVRKICKLPDDGTPVTIANCRSASSTIDSEKEQLAQAEKTMKEYADSAKESREARTKEKAYDEAYNKLSPEDKAKLDKITAKDDTVKTKKIDGKDVQYIEHDGKEMFKPDPDDPDYDEKLKKWDEAVLAGYATMEIGEKPVLKDDPKPEDLAAMRQWEMNRKAKDAARQDWYEKHKNDENGRYKNPEDALDKLDDDEFLKYNKDNLENFDDDSEDAQLADGNETESEKKEREQHEQKIKDLKDQKDAINNNAELTPDEKKKKLAEIDKKIEDTEDTYNSSNDNNRTNPAKIWKRKKNKTTGKSTKRYYYCGSNAKRKESGESISKKEYLEKMEKFKKRRASNESLKTDVRFIKSKWTMTPIFG